jgi:two-component system response regulator MprA
LTMSKPWRILVVDDDRWVAGTVQRVLRPEGYEVDVVFDGESALVQTAAKDYDLVILDVMMPGIDGLEVCRQLRAQGRLAVLMLTARGTIHDRVGGLDRGADDYLVKPFEYEELLARVRALLRRTGSQTREHLTLGDLKMDVDSREVWRGERRIDLTTTEFELLRCFLRHPRQVLNRDQLLSAVWPDHVVDDNVVAVYVSYLRAKLEERGDTRLLQTVRGAGYALREP